MPETISVNRELGIIEVHSSDDISEADLIESIMSVKKISLEEGIQRVLVDVCLQSSMPDLGALFKFAKSFPAALKFAVWISQNQTTIAEVEFVQLAAANRGSQIQLFTERESAISWLGI
jgi:hypothetical protein